jgi:hypothetical protein
MAAHLRILVLCLLALAVSGAARQSDAPTALVKNMTEAYKTEKVMEGRVVFAFYYDSSKNGGNSPVGWSNTFSTLEKVADELKDIAVLGYIDSSVERKLSLQAGIKQSVELRVFLPLFPDSQMRFDELIYDANRFRPDFESASLRRIRRFVKGLDVGGEQFAPVLKNALQAIVRKEALGDHLSSILEVTSELKNKGTDLSMPASLILSQLKAIRKQVKLNKTIDSVLEAQFVSLYSNIAAGQCGITEFCCNTYRHLQVIVIIFNAHNNKQYNSSEVYTAMKAAKGSEESKSRELAGLPTDKELEEIQTEEEMYRVLLNVDKLKSDCDEQIVEMEESIIVLMQDNLGVHELTTKGRLKDIRKLVDDRQPTDSIKGSYFKKYAKRYAKCMMSGIVRNRISAMYDKLHLALKEKFKLDPTYYEVEAVPTM